MIQDYLNETENIVYWIAYNSDNTYANHGQLSTNQVLSYAYDHIQTYSNYEAYKAELATFNIILEEI